MRPDTGRHSLTGDVIASSMVAAFSMAVALGFARVFPDWVFVGDMAIIVLAGHGAGLLMRRLRLASWIAVPATAAVLVWTLMAVYFPETFSWALPTSDTWSLLQTQLTSARGDFRTAVAPVEYADGWNVLAAIGLATSVLLADVFAFRAEARAEALVPGGVLFVFVGALGDERLRIASAVVLVGVGVVTTVALRWYHAESRTADAATIGRRWPAALAVGVIIALAAGLVGPRLPGADAAPLYETSGGSGNSTQVINPLVDIQSRLTDRSTTELFRVRADSESYWRSSALPEFDGSTWRLPERDLEPVDDAFDASSGELSVNRQQITIGALGGTLIPTAPSKVAAASPQADLRWAPETSTLLFVDGSLQTGDVIDAVSESPLIDPATLNAATSTDIGDPIYTSFPDDLPEVVATTASQVTASAQTSYEAALLLQQWFQSEFRYSLEIQSGHGNSAIESFLENRVGYCEQFAGTYAAMMRTLGVPSRVAVGFTSGISQGDGEYSVIGRNAHAWPEVWFDDIGWVLFEPTPQRGAPNAENYTLLPPSQDNSVAAGDVDNDDVTPPTTVPTGPDNQTGGLEIPDALNLPPTDLESGDTSSTVATAADSAGASPWLIIAVLLTAALVAPALIRFVRGRRRPQSVDHQVANAWQRATGAIAAAGVPVHGSDTPLEVAASTADHFPLATRPMASLAEVVTEATYGASGTTGYDRARAYGDSTISDCRNWAKQIDRTASESLEWRDRVRRYFTTFG